MKIRIALYVVVVSVGFSCADGFRDISRSEWRLKYHDSLVKDTIELNKITFSFKKRNEKTLRFNRDGSFYYAYKSYPFFNRSDYLICGTDELEILNGSSYYKIRGDTLVMRFKGSEFSSRDCCNYDLNRALKVYRIDKRTVRLVKLSDLD